MLPVTLCLATDVPEEGAVRFPTGVTGLPDAVAVFRHGGRLWALDDTCSHALASLSEGWVEDGEVECPLHSARFSLATGAALCLPATRAVGVHRVEEVGGEVVLHPGGTPVEPPE